MKSKNKNLLLRIKALLVATTMLVTLNACSKKSEVDDIPKIYGTFYLVPYNDHLYMITENHDVLNYDFRIAGYEGGSNMHELRFYRLNGEEIGDGFRREEVGFFHFDNEEEMKMADEMALEYGQRPVSYYLNQANETYIETTEYGR